LPREAGDPETLTLAPYAFEGPRFEAETARFDKVVEVISGIRQIRGENNLGAKPMGVVLSAGADVAAMEAGQAYITRLGRISALTIEEVATAPEGSAAVRAGDVDVIVPLQGLVDFGAERARLQKVVGKLQKEMLRSNKKLQNPKFVERAAPAAVEKERGKLAQLEAEHRTAEQALSRLPAE